jgi:hypothetical protein
MTESVDRYGELYGGLLLHVQHPDLFKPITFPFESVVNGLDTVTRGNHSKVHDNLKISSFDYWLSGHDVESNSMYVAERGISINGRMVGANSEETLRGVTHRVLTINEGIKPDERSNILDMVSNIVFPTLQTPALISLSVQSSQPKFILLSRDIPIHVNVFCDDMSMLLIWSNSSDLDTRMREVYGNRFSVFRMKPIVNCAIVLQSYYLKKKMNRWRHEIRDRLKIMNTLEGMVTRKSKGDSEDTESSI